jgi:hypothetical protein
MMRHLLNEHPLLLPFAHNLNVAMGWAAKLARAEGLTVEQAQIRFGLFMLADDLPDEGHDDDG